MAEKKVTVRMVAEGGGALRAELVGVGAAGKEAFARVEEGSKSAAASAAVFVQALDRETLSFTGLRAQLDPAYAATRQFEAAVESANRAVMLGAASQREAAQVIDLARARMDRATVSNRAFEASVTKLGKSSGSNIFVLRNLAYQFNQIGQMGAVTGDYLTALSVQLPDILSAFGGLGLILTGGALAMGASFIPALLGVEDAGKKAEKQMKALDAAVQEFKQTSSASNLSMDKLIGDYGNQYAATAKAVIDVQRDVAARRLQSELTAATRSLADTGFGGLGERSAKELRESADNLDVLKQAMDEFEASARSAGSALERSRFAEQFAEAANAYNILGGKDLQPLIDSLGISAGDAADLAAAIQEANDASGWQDQAAAIRAVIAEIQNATANTDGTNEAADELLTAWSSILERVLEFAKADIAAGVAGAADEAARLAGNLGIAVGEAAKLLALRSGGTGRGAGSVDPRTAGGTLYDWQNRDAIVFLQNYKPPRTARGGGGGGGKVNKEEAEAQKIFEQTRTEIEKYNAELARLNELHDAGYLSTETFDRAIAKLNEDFRRSDMKDFADEVKSLADDIAQAAVNSENLAEVFSNSLRKMAADLFSSGIQTLVTNLFGSVFGGGGIGSGVVAGGVGSVAPLFSFAGGGDTPDWARSGGLDGRGGFLALMHPRERVIDKTVSGAQAGGTDGRVVELIIHAADGVTVDTVRNEAQAQVRQGLSAYDRQLPSRVKTINRDLRAV